MNQGNNKFVCPHCHSNNISKCSVIYKNGVTKHNYTSEISGTIEYDMFHRRDFTGEMETTGISMTDLAKRCAPPKKQSDTTIPGIIAGLIVLGMIFPGLGLIFSIYDKGIFWVLGMFLKTFVDDPLGCVFGLSITVFALYFGFKYQSERTQEVEDTYNSRYKDWCDSYLCLRCGNRFVLR